MSAVTRADHVGADAANLLNKNFVVAGTKGASPSSYVFDQYTVNYVANTANTTESNSNNWEYVGQPLASTSSLSGTQTIKYWDYGTTQYDFAAYSLGVGFDSDDNPATDNTKAVPSAIAAGNKSYTLTGSADELKAAYISDLVTAYNRDGVNDYGNPVQFKFRSLAAKIRLAFYETVPGYSVKNVKFYTSSSADLASDGTENDPTLFATSSVLPSGSGTMTVTFPCVGWDNRNKTDYNMAHVSFDATNDASDLSSTLTLEDLADYPTVYEGELTSGNYLGLTSNTATYAGGLVSGSGKYYTILPYETGANLQLRIKYTLVSTDGSAEEINVDNATAVIPAELAKWSPNYAYTYIFKISDMTNGSTGVDGNDNVVTGLTPITLDALVVDSEDGVQETITTVSEPSITTYSEGEVVTANNEYKTGSIIYIIVNNGTSNETLTDNANLYTVTLTAGDGAKASAAQNINETSVDNVLTNGTPSPAVDPTSWSVTDANGWIMTVTKSNLMTLTNEIAAADSPTGNAINIGTAKVGKFTAGAAGTTYVFEFAKAAVAAVYTAVPNGTTLTEGETYYTGSDGSGGFTSSGSEVSDGNNYWELTTPASAAAKQYKIIQIKP